MTLYEKIKNMSIDEMAEYLAILSIGSAFSFMFNIQDKEFVKNLNEYKDLLSKTRSLLMEDDDE